jgi:NADH-quinone oxidoreductase subunit H
VGDHHGGEKLLEEESEEEEEEATEASEESEKDTAGTAVVHTGKMPVLQNGETPSPRNMNQTLVYILLVVGLLATLLTLSAALIYIERRLLALWQDRYGPNRVGPFGLFQVVADGIKLFFKEDWIPPFADRSVFVVAPGVIMVATMLSFAIVPFAPHLAVSNMSIGVLFFLAMSSLAVYSVALAGWSSNNKYALLGCMRAVGQMVSYEVFMGLSLMGVVVMAGSFELDDIVVAQEKYTWFCFPQFVGLVVFFIAGLAETRRLPFDLPEAENELVAGYHTEYSSMKFALFFLGEYVGITLTSALIVTLFFGGWLAPTPWLGTWIPPIFWFAAKTMLCICLFILLRATLPRPRYDQLMSFGWKLMLPLSLLNLAATGAAVLLWRTGAPPGP